MSGSYAGPAAPYGRRPETCETCKRVKWDGGHALNDGECDNPGGYLCRTVGDLAAALTRVAELTDEVTALGASHALQVAEVTRSLKEVEKWQDLAADRLAQVSGKGAELGALRERLERGMAVAREWLVPANKEAGGSFVRAQAIADRRKQATLDWLASLDASPQAAPSGDAMPPTGLEPRGCPTPGACSCPAATPVQGAPRPTGTEAECETCAAQGKQCIAGNGMTGNHLTYANMTTGACAFCGHPAAPAVQGAPPEVIPAINGPWIPGQAAPADGPTCPARCGGINPTANVVLEASDYMWCSPACRSAGRPLRPVPAVPEPNLGLALPLPKKGTEHDSRCDASTDSAFPCTCRPATPKGGTEPSR